VKRILIFGGLLVLLVVLAGATVIGSAFLGRQAITDGFEINGIRMVQDGFVSVAVVPMGQGEVALVDAGNDPSGEAIRAELSRRGMEPGAVKAVLITHGHRDHITGIAAFPRAAVMALAAEIPLAEGRAGASGPVTRLFPVRPTGVKVTLPLQDGDGAMLGDTMVRVYAVPGHTGGSAAYLVNGVLFLGDSADATTKGELRGAPWAFSDDAAQNRASLVRLHQRLVEEGLTVQAIAFAHSGVLARGLAPLAAFAEEVEEERRKAEGLLTQ
jgi:glyoxylase-like metal-dependent hydrolase (beta-lactamase superfamily II)